MQRAGALMLIVVALSARLVAQEQPRFQAPAAAPHLVFYEAISMPSPDSGKSRVDVLYRIDSDFFVAVRNGDPSIFSPFRKRGEVLVELVDSLGVSRARDISRIDAGALSNEPLERKEWQQGLASFTVPPGLYTIVFEVNDLESDRRYLQRSETVRARDFSPSKLDIGKPHFVFQDNANAAGDTIRPMNFGGNLLFGTRAALLFSLAGASASAESLRIEYTLSLLPRRDGDEPGRTILTGSLSGGEVAMSAGFVPGQGNGRIWYLPQPMAGARMMKLIIPIPTDTLQLRAYSLKVTARQGTSNSESVSRFSMIWPDMPRSLKDVDRAFAALKYITSEKELDSLKRGTFEQRRDALEGFWKMKDKTPATSYNEVMTEYYRRVDYAEKTFGTLRAPNGFATDRGRIFILYGPPTKVDRNLNPSTAYEEVWTYEALGKRFIFVDQSKSGVYTLVSTETL